MNQLAPEKTKLILKNEKRPWYNDEMANMKTAVRSKKIWVRNGTMISWKSNQQVRRFYQIKMAEKMIITISKKIKECGSDTKKSFKFVNHLTGCKPENPLLDWTTHKELGDEFADFSYKK